MLVVLDLFVGGGFVLVDCFVVFECMMDVVGSCWFFICEILLIDVEYRYVDVVS